MRINIHAGHNPDGKVACGAIGLIKESTAARGVVKLLIPLLQKAGHTVFDCTVDNGTSQSDVLNKIIRKCNSNVVDLDISIHFNAGAKDLIGNGQTTGVEVLVYDKSDFITTYANKVCDNIANLGYKNRGVKVRQDLGYLKGVAAPAMLIECCFVDDMDDVKLYSAETMAKAISQAIIESVGAEEKRYNKISELPDWAKPTIEKLVKDGKISDGNNLGMTLDMVRVLIIMNR